MNNIDIDMVIEDSPIYLSSSDIVKIGIITNELLTNSIKHAFKDIKGKVNISLKKEEKYIIYKYIDNGKESIKIEKEDTLGLKIINMLAEQMDADILLSTKKGFSFELRIPNSLQ